VSWSQFRRRRVSEGPDLAPVEPSPEVPSQPETTPEAPKDHFLKWWTFLLVLVPVWIPAAAIGVGLYYWWFHSFDKTWPVFVVLVFVISCTVAGLLLAMAAQRPLIAALAIAVIAAPFAAAVGALPLHGTYYCEKSVPPIRCAFGLIPY
jgi:asparagine N-glycosylation enzyme membrane subunit Stt3